MSLPFAYPSEPHIRKHGPAGYTDYSTYKQWLRDEFTFTCVYCLKRERWVGGDEQFGVEHIVPKNDAPDLECVYENLAYACNDCNSARGRESTFDPSLECAGEHFELLDNGSVVGRTDLGEELVRRLRINARAKLREAAMAAVKVAIAHPETEEARTLLSWALGFPEDLPDLTRVHPTNNTRPAGVKDCYFVQRREGRLPPYY